MKMRYVWFLLLVLSVGGAAFILKNEKKERSENEIDYCGLLPRKEALAYTAEWAVVKNNAGGLLEKISKDPADVKSLMALTALYLQEARITGNFDYYNEAAMRNINQVLAKDEYNFEALTFKATVLLSQHQFEEAHHTAEAIRQRYPYNAYVYGLLVDAEIELGRYNEALDAADQMVSIRPDIRSYSRIAYLREIYGDLPGAIEAMQLALAAGAPGDENTEWCRVQMGKLNEKIGKLADAEMHYTLAAEYRHNFPYAMAGLAGIALAKKDYSRALALFQQADSLLPDHSFKEGIAEVFHLTGEPEKAAMAAREIVRYMKKFSSSIKKHKNTGQNEDHEMAHAYMGVEDYDKALEYALLEYNRRPANIEVNETVAVVYYEKGEYSKALPHIETALKTGCKNPELLCHAGLIYYKNGKTKEAKAFLQDGLKNSSTIGLDLKKESRESLKALN